MAGRVCAVFGCKNYSVANCSKSFFRFPKDETQCKQWVLKCKRADLDVVLTKNGPACLYNRAVCSDHFSKEDLRNPNMPSQGLLRGVVPSQNLPGQNVIANQQKSPKKRRMKSPTAEVQHNVNDAVNSASVDEELASVEYELQEVQAKIQSLQDRKKFLERRRDQLKDSILLEKSTALANQNWTDRNFPWSVQVDEVLKKVFRLEEFRPQQLAAVNAVLKKEDVILIMPTGGGKSLCYQLPAHVRPGVALVISPLISLMEDQLMGLHRLGVDAAMLSAQSTKQDVDNIQKAMLESKASLRLLYVTPEKLAKSKRFMTKLQKMYQVGRLSLIAIDEVHCCSQWGHDFRPDYKFLGVLKPMFPDVPILGLTATATSRVTVDVQKMLGIQGCLVLKATFNRPNLYYEVRQKPSVQKECMDELAALLKGKYAGQSGIIYSTSIKDCEDLMQELRARSLQVGCYHASLDATLRSKVHAKWMSGEYQAVVATIAFGLGIDKPDVRFVIHHCLSKSMENFYQESGRAGRDNKNADCIVFYRFMDMFKLSTMVFTQQTGLENLYGIVAYCLDANRCRRSIIASHFDEAWETQDCNSMCDHCRQPREVKKVEITSFCQALYKVLAHAASSDTRLTAQKLVDAWLGKGAANLRVPDVTAPRLMRETAEGIVAYLLIEGYLKEDFHFTPYNTISYIRRGVKANLVQSGDHKIYMDVRGKNTPSYTAPAACSSSGQATTKHAAVVKATEGTTGSVNGVVKEQKVSSSQQRSSSGDASRPSKRKSATSNLAFSDSDESNTSDGPSKKKKIISVIISSGSDDET